MLERKLAFDFATTQKIIQRIGQIDQFKGTWQQLEKADNVYLRELRRIATIQSIGSSTRIEGNTMTDAEVATFIKNLKIAKLQTRDEQEVAGYYDTLATIIENYENIPINVSSIHTLHNLLLKYSNKDNRHKGKFKALANSVVANYPDGTTHVIFNTTPPFLVEKEMQDVIDWTNNALETAAMHPLIVIGTFVYEFLSIHPYQDGNGRLSRLLTNLLLLKTDYKFVLYVSLEQIVEKKKAAYYQALMSGQKERNKDTEIINDWTLFFLESLSELVVVLAQKIAEYRKIGCYLTEKQKAIRDFIASNQPLKNKDIQANFPDFSKNSIKNDLIYLENAFEIEKIGEKRAAIYIIKKHHINHN